MKEAGSRTPEPFRDLPFRSPRKTHSAQAAMRILFIGDIVGRSGRRILREQLANLKDREAVDFTIANVENAAGGFGITPKIGRDILSRGVDVMTSGNHIWDKREVLDYIEEEPRLLRPGNYPPGTPGASSIVTATESGQKVAVLNLQGRVFMPLTDCPFRAADSELETLRRETPIIVVDFHAEATSEKMAFGRYLDGRATAVLGTHTHVATADGRVLPAGTAYVSDVGMTGAADSVIGMTLESSLPRFLTGRPNRFQVATGSPQLSSVVIDVEDSSGRALSIRRLDVLSSDQPG